MFDSKDLIESIMGSYDKDSEANKVAEAYLAFISGSQNEDKNILNASELLNIENKYRKLVEENQNTDRHQNKSANIMQPEESVLALIEDLRRRNLLK